MHSATRAYARSHLRSINREISAAERFLVTHDCDPVKRGLVALREHKIRFVAYILALAKASE
jgi:hypothetical protein